MYATDLGTQGGLGPARAVDIRTGVLGEAAQAARGAPPEVAAGSSFGPSTSETPC
jgi:hypothetical protein